MSERPINPFPEQRIGLRRVRAIPHLYKDRWPEALWGDRWRRHKAKMRAVPAGPTGAVGSRP